VGFTRIYRKIEDDKDDTATIQKADLDCEEAYVV